MDLSPDTSSAYARKAFDALLAVADRLGDELVNERPLKPHTNSVAALIVHCCGVSEFWLGHVGVGRPDHREREQEFSAQRSVAELHDLVARTVAQVDADLRAIDAGATSPHGEARAFLDGDTQSASSLVVHVLEELYQHLGHCEITADALLG